MSMLNLKSLTLVAVTCFFGGAPLHQYAAEASSRNESQKLISVIQSGATEKEKADACRELARVGGKEAVGPLIALLPDEKLSHMARYALETIPDPSVDKALRDSLSKLQ